MSATEPRPLLAVIPCRGGSKRIPRKWAALVDGKPLLQHAIDIAQAASITRLVVSTEDHAVAAYARLRGVEVHHRPDWLAADDVPLADVVADLVNALGWEHDVMVLQPTCPLLKPDTVDWAVGEWRHSGADWAITVAPDPHLFWQAGAPITPRINSQKLMTDWHCLMSETGAVQLFSNRASLGVTQTRYAISIDPDEALDIDTHADLAAARQALTVASPPS